MNRIDNATGVQQINQRNQAENRGGVARPSQTDAAPTQDRVSLSASSEQLGALSATVQAAPAVNTARVEALRDAIANGQYQPNPEALADALLATERDLGR